jgi:membrane protease YdiL (CAAX protease family)
VAVLGVIEPVAILIAAGAVGQVATWREVRAGRISVWLGMGFTMGVLGALSLITGLDHLSPDVNWGLACVVGIATGLALFAATRVFVAIASAWDLFRRHVAEIYGNRSGVSLRIALLVAVGLSVPGEELFWRGLVGGRFAELTGDLLAGAAIALAGYVAVCAFSGNLAVIAGAVVGGGLWSVLFVWTGGVLASLCSHAVFTGLMIAAPPPAATPPAAAPAGPPEGPDPGGSS